MSDNLTPEKLLETMKLLNRSGMSEDVQKHKLTEMAMRNMTREQSDRFREVMGDANALNRLLESDHAKRLMKKMSEKQG